mgnify:CR=1 FL=1
MKLKPLADRVVIKQVQAEEKTKGGIILASAAQEKPQVAEIVAVGPGGIIDGKEGEILTVNHPNYGWLVDIGNFICADENCAISVGKLKDFIAHVHAKDFFIRSGMEPDPGRGWFQTRAGNYIRGTILGHGVIPVTQCLAILKRAGWVVL